MQNSVEHQHDTDFFLNVERMEALLQRDDAATAQESIRVLICKNRAFKQK
jgi:hypothetical protein